MRTGIGRLGGAEAKPNGARVDSYWCPSCLASFADGSCFAHPGDSLFSVATARPGKGKQKRCPHVSAPLLGRARRGLLPLAPCSASCLASPSATPALGLTDGDGALAWGLGVHGAVAWKTAQRFPLMCLIARSGQGFAVVHATGPSTNTFRLANRPVQQGEHQCRGVGRAAWMRREVQWAMDGPSGPTPERRWCERTRSAA